MPTTLQTHVQNLARGGGTYLTTRDRLFVLLTEHPSDRLEPLSPFLAGKFFKLRKGAWYVLGFSSRDWRVVERIRRSKSLTADFNYGSLLCDYILANVERVKALYEVSDKISADILSGDGSCASESLTALDDFDRQSLFAFRLYAAVNSHSHDDLTAHFQSQLTTDWLRQRFLYPFIYHVISHPMDAGIDAFLSYMVPEEDRSEEQRVTVRFLLRDELAYTETFAFKAYIGLLCHPYDACEMLLNHLESSYYTHSGLPPLERKLFDRLAAVISSPRLVRLTKLFDRCELPVSLDSDPATLATSLGLTVEAASFYAALLSVRSWEEPPRPPNLLGQHVLAMRACRFPDSADHLQGVSTVQRWHFIEAGRFLTALSHSQYLVPRRERIHELRQVGRLFLINSAITPFITASPRGFEALAQRLVGGLILDLPVIDDLFDAELSDTLSRDDRVWIKGANWTLRFAEQEFRPAEWLGLIAANVPVTPPPFITGVDWDFVDEIIKVYRIAPFEGRAEGVFALLLQQIEDPQSDSTRLRTAIEPFTEGKAFGDVIDWLLDTFREGAVALVRYFMTAENILWLELAPNLTAALSARVTALEQCVRRFKFGPLITEQQFENEWRALTAALMLRRVGAEQFDLPWDMFKRDAIESEADSYSTYVTLTPKIGEIALLSEARLTTPYRFANGEVVTYTFATRDSPLVMLVLPIIEMFMRHPAFGIEVVLSSRFRHDTLRKEFVDAFQNIRSSHIAGVSQNQLETISGAMEDGVLQVLQRWIDRHLHTRRSSRPDAFFNFAPSPDELTTLIAGIPIRAPFEQIVDDVVGWIQRTLDLQLVTSRENVRSELADSVNEALDAARERLTLARVHRLGDITLVANAARASMSRLLQQLEIWFTTGEGREEEPLTLREIKFATDGLFETAIASGRLKTTFAACPQGELSIKPWQVRLYFTLLREVYANVLKPGRVREKGGRLRIWPHGDEENCLVFSSLTVPGEPYANSVPGRRYDTVSEALFREGNSGIPKIAALAASLMGVDMDVQIVRRRQSFHLLIRLPTLMAVSSNA